MLLLSRTERSDFLQLQDIDLPKFITDLWAGVSAGLERRFELGDVPPLELTADPDRLAQALRNLIGNAIEHTQAPHGLVGLQVERLGDERVRFAVIDDGPGIEPGQRVRVFERFHRTDEGRDRASGGAGLGLAIVQAIAHAHGGQVRVAPAPSGGARLELDLPRSRLRSATVRHRSGKPPAHAPGVPGRLADAKMDTGQTPGSVS
jgi:signal transduction histidine kinase